MQPRRRALDSPSVSSSASASQSHEPDPDNLLKSTFDAMGGALGFRRQRGMPQADDERIDFIEVLKREARDGEEWGATIEVYEPAPA